jgi:hypothetical protein
MVGTTRFELATSPTQKLGTIYLSMTYRILGHSRKRRKALENAYWPHNGPTVGPTPMKHFRSKKATDTEPRWNPCLACAELGSAHWLPTEPIIAQVEQLDL